MWTLTNDLEWEDLRNQFSWVRDMEGVPQDPVFHAEGDVAVHTRMVLEALQGLEGFQALDEQNQAILMAAALLHDVEKRSTTQLEEDGRITSRGHAKKGALTAQRLLFAKHQAPFAIRQQVVGLVRHHGLPLWALEKRDPIPTLLRASLELDMRLLALLAEADVKGRVCEDQQDLLLRIGLFQAFCEEQSCWESMAEFPSRMAKYAFLNGKSSYRDYVPFEKDPFEVVLLSGLPGMGKDHFIQTHYQDWPVISLDQLRRDKKVAPSNKKATGQIVQEAKEMAKRHLRQRQSFVWNATNLTFELRSKLIDLFQTYGAHTKVVYLEVDHDRWRTQNRNREHMVPNMVLDRMLSKWQVPKLWEAPIVEYHLSGGK